MLKREAAELLGVSPARISQLIRDGYLKPTPDGSITTAALEHCRRHAPVAWQVTGAKSVEGPPRRWSKTGSIGSGMRWPLRWPNLATKAGRAGTAAIPSKTLGRA